MIRRKMFFILALLIILIILGCSDSNISTDTNPKPESKSQIQSDEQEQAIEYENLWNVDIGIDGYIRNYASHHISWEAENVTVTWSTIPAKYSEKTSDDMETYVSDGVTYYTKDESIFWDSYDLKEGGIKHIRRIVFIEGEYQYNLSIVADNDKSLLIPVETCVEILSNTENTLEGFEKTTEFWYVGFKKENISVNVSIYPSPYGIDIYSNCSSNEEFQLIRDNDIEYYYISNERTEDEPNHAAVYWLNDIGLVELGAGVPYSERNDVPSDALEFIDIELAKSIVMQMS